MLTANYLADLKLHESNVLTFKNENPVIDGATADLI